MLVSGVRTGWICGVTDTVKTARPLLWLLVRVTHRLVQVQVPGLPVAFLRRAEGCTWSLPLGKPSRWF